MSISLKYAVVERERRFLLASLPDGVVSTKQIVDRYVTGTRLRLREVREDDGSVIRKLAHKVRLTEGPAEVACTNFYLNDQEWAVLGALPAQILRKKRHMLHRDGLIVAVDEHEDGTLVAEIDDRDQPSQFIPDWLDIHRRRDRGRTLDWCLAHSLRDVRVTATVVRSSGLRARCAPRLIGPKKWDRPSGRCFPFRNCCFVGGR